jgi:hypothetical protein
LHETQAIVEAPGLTDSSGRPYSFVSRHVFVFANPDFLREIRCK